LRIDDVHLQARVGRELPLDGEEAEGRVVEVDAEDRRGGRAARGQLQRRGAGAEDAERLVAADDAGAAVELPPGGRALEVTARREERLAGGPAHRQGRRARGHSAEA